MTESAWQILTVDIDGTLTLVHGWGEIAHAFGREAEFGATQRRFFAHEEGEDEHLATLLDLATGRTVAEVDAVVDRTPKLAGIGEGIRDLHRQGVRVLLLTHNPGYVVDFYRRTFGFDDGAGVTVPVGPDGRIGHASSVHADKVGALRALLQPGSVDPRRVVHVGDGWSDAEVFRQVGGGIALNSRLPEVRAAADLALETRDFRDVVAALGALRPRP